MRRVAKIAGIILGCLLLVVAILPFLISADRFKPMLESRLSSALARQVTIGHLRLSLLSGGMTADSIAIAEDPAFGGSPFLQAESLDVGVELWPLIVSRKLNVTNISIEQPKVMLLQSTAGRWNYSSLGGSPSSSAGAGSSPSATPPQPAQTTSGQRELDLRVKRVRIVDGQFSVAKTGGRQKMVNLEKVNVEVRDFSPSTSFPFSLTANVAGGGNIKLEGKAGPISTAGAELTPASMKLDIDGLNLASALAGTAPGLGGTGSLHATGKSSDGRVTLSGNMTAQGLKLVKNGTPARKPVQFGFAVAHDVRAHSGVLQRGDIKVGAASASLTGTYADRGDATVLHMKLAGANMPVPELAELLPPLGIELPRGSRLESGTATVAFTVDGPADQVVADGSVSLNQTRLANFDLGAKIMLVAQAAGIKAGPNTDIETFRAKLRRTPAGTSVENLQLVSPGVGELTGKGSISPANALDFAMAVTIHTTRSALVSKTAIPFMVQGTAADPVFKPDVRGLAKTGAKTLLESEAQKRLKGPAGDAAVGILDKLLGSKDKDKNKKK